LSIVISEKPQTRFVARAHSINRSTPSRRRRPPAMSRFRTRGRFMSSFLDSGTHRSVALQPPNVRCRALIPHAS